MERKNKCKKFGFSTVLWAVGVFMLCAAPCIALVLDDNHAQVHNISSVLEGQSLQVDNATVNLLPGAYIEWWIIANNGSIVNIKGGNEDSDKNNTVGLSVTVNLGSNVKVYGTYFEIGDVEHFAGEEIVITLSDGPLTVVYENGQQVDLPIDCISDTGGESATITLAAPGGGPVDPIEVLIDIKPGSDPPNPINPGSNGLIPVAVLTTETFDAAKVDPGTVTLAGQDVAVRGKAEKLMERLEDVDGDGDLDLLVQVETQSEDSVDALWESGFVTLTGNLFDKFEGTPIEGEDEIIIVPPQE